MSCCLEVSLSFLMPFYDNSEITSAPCQNPKKESKPRFVGRNFSLQNPRCHLETKVGIEWQKFAASLSLCVLLTFRPSELRSHFVAKFLAARCIPGSNQSPGKG